MICVCDSVYGCKRKSIDIFRQNSLFMVILTDIDDSELLRLSLCVVLKFCLMKLNHLYLQKTSCVINEAKNLSMYERIGSNKNQFREEFFKNNIFTYVTLNKDKAAGTLPIKDLFSGIPNLNTINNIF